MRGLSALLVLCAACASPSTHSTQPPPAEAPRTREVPRFSRIELELPGDATFTAPSGRVIPVLSFASRGRTLVRFTPQEVGRYGYVSGGVRGSFQSVPSDARGFVHADLENPRRLVFDDGKPFVMLGENRINIYDPAWNHGHLSSRDYIAYMAGNGMTALRVFMFTDAEGEDFPDHRQPGCLEPRMGEFDDDVAEEFDAIMEAAEAHGIQVVLTLFALGFTPDETWKSWDDNPYNVVNGGIVDDPWSFFDEPEARAEAKNKLRYVLARYGSSTSLLAIDLVNEPEWDGEIGEDTWIPWAQELAEEWTSLDPYEHFVTTGSVGLHWNIEGDERRWYADARNGMIQWHRYGSDIYDVHALSAELHHRVREGWDERKPIFCGEFAWGGEEKPLYDHTHVGIWTLVFSGAGALAHSAPPFNIDSDEPMTPERGAHFRVLRDFLDGLDQSRALAPTDLGVTLPGTQALALARDDYAAIWVMGPRAGYASPVDNERVTLVGMQPGTYSVRWIDDVTGAVVTTETRQLETNSMLSVPSFTRHIAAVVAREMDQ